ncbi:DUF1254 domain-containing protein [Carboxylicivirga sp. M1479]|uniref:DUF1254 domain-containing protein n=1 Tax=Carboxylicivirga sp. M1479 TaxID=2594476 RepID=UPI0011787B60|nr:DUF1254 domain-containing protein [Carboxylicivirga sp. M1479]TRX72507.1 DUF1254 domain-containing protein [Carboxylicivirga sp. M1479]
MKTLTYLIISSLIIVTAISCGTKPNKETKTNTKTAAGPERPSDADLMAFKVYHHMHYMVTTAEQAGGTNKLLHTKQLPTEGTDPVVTPALDHIYSKVVVDLSEGPVTVEYPEIEEGRYYSIHITDQEHYTIFDEIHPKGKYTIVRKGQNMDVPIGATVIESPGDYPHLFIRVQVQTAEDLTNAHAIQEKIKLSSAGSKTLVIDNYIKHTIETHDVYPQNKETLASKVNFTNEDYLRVSQYIGVVAPKFGKTGNIGMFGAIDSDEPNSNNAEYRAAAIVGHLGFPLHHAFYRPFFANCNGEVLNGDKTEAYTIPYKPEGCGLFWSITRYSALTRNTLPGKNDLFNAYNTKPDENGNITITFSVEDPNDGTYWMPVNAGEPYYFVARYYKPDVNNLPKEPCKQ